jgi:hypothetical protein
VIRYHDVPIRAEEGLSHVGRGVDALVDDLHARTRKLHRQDIGVVLAVFHDQNADFPRAGCGSLVVVGSYHGDRPMHGEADRERRRG